MVNIHSNNKDGSTTVSASQQPDNTTNISNVSSVDYTQSIDQVSLPAGQQTVGSINYFGSSYSGADIKVYANMYNDKSGINEIIPQLEEERDYTQAIVDATTIIKNSPTDVAEAVFNPQLFFDRNSNYVRNQFLTKIGLGSPTTNAEQLAAQFMVNQFLGQFTNATSGLTTGFPQIRTSADSVINNMRNIITQLDSQIDVLKNDRNIGGSLFYLGTLQTLSLQSHREKFGVRSLGRSHVKGYTRGPRTIAGSMIFTVFHEHAFAALMRRMSLIERDPEISFLLPDQLPPIDLTVLFSNEYGQQSEFRIYGLEILNDGVTYSIEDLLSENVMQFVCRDVDPLKSRGRVVLDRSARNAEIAPQEISASSLYKMNNEYNSYLERLHVRRRLLSR